jgi:dihydrofolate reductase
MTGARRPAELVLIAAVARNGVIGRDNGLAFRDSADLQRFRQLTLGCPVLMGRRTWDSLPPRFRPLPGRRNVVLSRDPAFRAAGAEVAAGLDEALALVHEARRVFVAGGAQLYAQALPHADTLLLTEVDADLEGDARFPAWDRAQFEPVSRSGGVSTEGIPYEFVTYRRR